MPRELVGGRPADRAADLPRRLSRSRSLDIINPAVQPHAVRRIDRARTRVERPGVGGRHRRRMTAAVRRHAPTSSTASSRRSSSSSASPSLGVLVEAFLPRRSRYAAQLALGPRRPGRRVRRGRRCSPGLGTRHGRTAAMGAVAVDGPRCSCRAPSCWSAILGVLLSPSGASTAATRSRTRGTAV